MCSLCDASVCNFSNKVNVIFDVAICSKDDLGYIPLQKQNSVHINLYIVDKNDRKYTGFRNPECQDRAISNMKYDGQPLVTAKQKTITK